MAKQIDEEDMRAIGLKFARRPRKVRLFSLFSIASLAICVLITAPASAQREYADIPIVAGGKMVKLTPNVYVIPDEARRGVPNVGIVVGSRATMVVDPGMGLQSGRVVLSEVEKVSKGNEIFIVNTHYHPEHTTGELAFPAHTKIIRAKVQQEEIDEMGLKSVFSFAQRSTELAEVLKEVTHFRRPSETFENEKSIDLGGVQVRLILIGPAHTRGDIAFA
jgi:glyoxylase-like metal-dependent hydrolase (beta-lactamase superfamily II)